MQSRGCYGATTIHSLIYRPLDTGGEVVFELNRESPVSQADLVIIDECSMVGKELGEDLLSFGTKVLVVGDPAQLPPVEGTGYFINREPDNMLTEIHRQLKDDPIVQIATMVRNGEELKPMKLGESEIIFDQHFSNVHRVEEADQVLCGTNNRRAELNRKIRDLFGMKGLYPQKGELVVCLKNDRQRGLLNGSSWIVQSSKKIEGSPIINMSIKKEGSDNLSVSVQVHENYFFGTDHLLPLSVKRHLDAFDFGYALTVHKAQGSQWDDVLIFDESARFGKDAQRWLYTAITRAARRVTIVRHAKA